MHRARLFVMLIVLTGLIAYSGAAEPPPEPPIKIGICFTAAGAGDLSFNNMLYNGSIEVLARYGEKVEFCYHTAVTDTDQDFERALTRLVEHEGCDLVLTLGFQARNALNRVAARYPDTAFALFDVAAEKAENVVSVIYAQHEGGFVAGALAAAVTQSKIVGFIGGVNIDILHAYLHGFKEGVAHIDPGVKVLVEYCSQLPDFSGFRNPEKGYNIAQKMYAKGADILFNGAGGSGPGIIQAAAEQQRYVIGTDSNQDYMAPGFVLTSVMKRLDTSMIDICERFIHGKFQGNTVYEYGYRNFGISLTPMEFTRKALPVQVLKRIHAIERQIVTGEIVVTNLLAQPE